MVKQWRTGSWLKLRLSVLTKSQSTLAHSSALLQCTQHRCCCLSAHSTRPVLSHSPHPSTKSRYTDHANALARKETDGRSWIRKAMQDNEMCTMHKGSPFLRESVR